MINLLEALRQVVAEPDVEVREGSTEHLYVLHKIKDGIHLYWVVNDTDEPRTNTLALRATGRPERWDAHTADRSPLFYQSDGGRTLIRLVLGPWDAAYVVFDASGPSQPLALSSTSLDNLYVVRASAEEVTVRGKALLKGEPLLALLSDGQHQFRGNYQAPNIEPVEIRGDWNVMVEAPAIFLPYALAIDDPDDRGVRERWYAETKSRLDWNPLWLSPMNCAIRDWNVIGPFPNPQDGGLEEHYPPEHGIEYEAVHEGDGHRELRWQRLNAAAYHAGPEGGGWDLGTMAIRGGPYGNESFVVNYGTSLRLSPPQGVVYAQTNVYSPQETDAVVVLATANPRAAFLNGNQVYSQWLRPLYNELVDGFADRVPVRLRSGWNSLLLKFLHNPENPQAPRFTCRIEKSDGTFIEGLLSASRVFDNPQHGSRGGYRWLRFFAPRVAGALRIPPLKNPWLSFVDEKQVGSKSEIPLPGGARVVTLRVAADEVLASSFAFSTVPATLPLGTWRTPGLEYFSGRMTYKKIIDVPAGLLTERLLLDCGEVGVVAEAWVNGNSGGSRAWAPYVFDVTDHLRAGTNHLRVRVANTAGNTRAVGEAHTNLDNIDLDGWYGPARLVPYVDREIQCRQI